MPHSVAIFLERQMVVTPLYQQTPSLEGSIAMVVPSAVLSYNDHPAQLNWTTPGRSRSPHRETISQPPWVLPSPSSQLATSLVSSEVSHLQDQVAWLRQKVLYLEWRQQEQQKWVDWLYDMWAWMKTMPTSWSSDPQHAASSAPAASASEDVPVPATLSHMV